MKQQLITMLKMQDEMNTRVHADWRDKNLEWYRAIWIECAELMDHFGWKWWKKQSPDRPQVILELVDIWHFGLSMVLMSGETLENCADTLCRGLDTSARETRFREDVEAFVANTIASRIFDVKGFSQLMLAVDLSFDDLYRRYVGKNVLNFFRQDHGYSDGSYIKRWDGREDNEHLVEIVDSLDASQPAYRDEVYRALRQRYQRLCQV